MRQLLLDTICSYEDVHENILECLILSDVEFISDFGPWKAGQKVGYVTFNFELGIAYSTDDEGERIEEMKFTLTPFVEGLNSETAVTIVN